jgi:hypothetical protein
MVSSIVDDMLMNTKRESAQEICVAVDRSLTYASRACCETNVLLKEQQGLIENEGTMLTFRLLTGLVVDDCKQEVKSEPKLGHDICEADQPHLTTKLGVAQNR